MEGGRGVWGEAEGGTVPRAGGRRSGLRGGAACARVSEVSRKCLWSVSGVSRRPSSESKWPSDSCSVTVSWYCGGGRGGVGCSGSAAEAGAEGGAGPGWALARGAEAGAGGGAAAAEQEGKERGEARRVRVPSCGPMRVYAVLCGPMRSYACLCVRSPSPLPLPPCLSPPARLEQVDEPREDGEQLRPTGRFQERSRKGLRRPTRGRRAAAARRSGFRRR